MEKDNLIKALKIVINKNPLFRKIYYKIREDLLKSFYNEYSNIYLLKSKKLFLIRVAWGCQGGCSYCAIKKAIGKLHSKPIEECIKEFKIGLKKGYKKFVLTADDIGAYGFDTGITLSELLERLTDIEGDYTISVLGLRPNYAIRYANDIERLLKDGKIMCLNIPIQSAQNRILKLMHRFSDVDKMKVTFLRFRKSYPNLALQTDIILGFPTETFEEMKQTLQFIKEVDFDGGIVYPFSSKSNTVAETIDPKITTNERNKRIKYTKNFLEKIGYRCLYSRREHFIMFDKKK